jgi:hypothetical protein
MLPGSCYQFPRRALIDDRGTFVTLSTFCQTAATLLYESNAELTIVASPPAFPERRAYEGLDARGQWPPLVRPGLMFDLESYSRWEAFIVSTLAGGVSVDSALASIAATAETLRTWTPECGPFDSWMMRSLPQPADSGGLNIYDRFRTPDAYEQLRRFVPEGLTPPQSPPELASAGERASDAASRAVRRYLASKAFASWCAYESRGIRTLVAELCASELVLRVECARACRAAGRALDRSLMIEAIRQSDLLLMHLIDRPRMVEWLGQVEVNG